MTWRQILQNPKVLLAEDNEDIQHVISLKLAPLCDSIISCSCGKEAENLIQKESFDFFILDWMLPHVNGMQLCHYIRNSLSSAAPILIVTALNFPKQIVEAFEKGVDDYITKPFDLDVLEARFKSLLKRGQKNQEQKIFSNEIMMNIPEHRVFLEDKEIHLTKSEFELLQYLLLNKGKVMTRPELKKIVQGGDFFVTDRTIDTHIFGLRKKLRHYSPLVESVRGVGYRFNEDF